MRIEYKIVVIKLLHVSNNISTAQFQLSALSKYGKFLLIFYTRIVLEGQILRADAKKHKVKIQSVLIIQKIALFIQN